MRAFASGKPWRLNEQRCTDDEKERVRFRLCGIRKSERKQRKYQQNRRERCKPFVATAKNMWRLPRGRSIDRGTRQKTGNIIRCANRKRMFAEEPLEERIDVKNVGRLDIPCIDIQFFAGQQ